MKGKVFLSALALCAAVGSAFAFKTSAVNDVYYLNASSQYQLVCSISGSDPCDFAPTTGTSGRYYQGSATPGQYTKLADNVQIFDRP